MLNPNDVNVAMEERKRQLLHDARLNQLMRQADDDREHTGERLMRLLGDLMIEGGTKLKARSRHADPVYTPHLQM